MFSIVQGGYPFDLMGIVGLCGNFGCNDAMGCTARSAGIHCQRSPNRQVDPSRPFLSAATCHEVARLRRAGSLLDFSARKRLQMPCFESISPSNFDGSVVTDPLTFRSPSRRFALPPADCTEQDRCGDHPQDKRRRIAMRWPDDSAHEYEQDIHGKDAPTLPPRRRTPAPAVTLCGKPVLVVRIHDGNPWRSRCRRSRLPGSRRRIPGSAHVRLRPAPRTQSSKSSKHPGATGG